MLSLVAGGQEQLNNDDCDNAASPIVSKHHAIADYGDGTVVRLSQPEATTGGYTLSYSTCSVSIGEIPTTADRLAVSVAVDSVNETACVAWAQRDRDATGSDDRLYFKYIIVDISNCSGNRLKTTEFFERLSWDVSSHSFPSGSEDDNAYNWFDGTNCDADQWDHSTYPNDWYKDEGLADGVDKFDADIKVVHADGSYWVACEAGGTIDHSTGNANPYEYEEHHGLYLFSIDSTDWSWDAEDVAPGGVHIDYNEECETNNLQSNFPMSRTTTFAADLDGTGTVWVLMQDVIFSSADHFEHSNATGYPDLGLGHGDSVPIIAVKDDHVFAVYETSEDTSYQSMDLGASPLAWSSATFIDDDRIPVAAGSDGTFGYSLLKATDTTHLDLFKDSSCLRYPCLGNGFKEYATYFKPERMLVDGSAYCTSLLVWGVEDRKYDCEWFFDEVTY
jgi:hypothetical protein